MKISFSKLLLFVSLCFISTSLFSQTVKELSEQKKTTEKEIAYVNSLLTKVANEKRSTVEQLNLIKSKISLRKKLIADSDIQLGLLTKEISTLEKNISELDNELSTLRSTYANFLVALYKNRKSSTWLMYVLASDDLEQAYRRLKYFRSFASFAESYGKQIEQKSAEHQQKIVLLREKKSDLISFQKQKQAEFTLLAEDESSAQLVQADLMKQERSLRASLAEKNRTLRKVNDEIERLIAEEARLASKKSNTSTSSSSSAPGLPAASQLLSTKFEANRGKLPWPLAKGVVIESFGNHFHPIFKGIKLPPNNGIDISTDAGSDVRAVFSGEVRRVFSLPGMGMCILIMHGEFFTLYCKFSSISVKAGDEVVTSQKLGTVQTVSNVSILHFELWKGTTKMNPELWLLPK